MTFAKIPAGLYLRAMRQTFGHLAFLAGGLLGLSVFTAASTQTPYVLQVLPPEQQRRLDPVSGAELLFITTCPEVDSNLYFHEFSWLGDESVILFTSKRHDGGLMGYINATGDLIRIHTPDGPVGGATAAARGNAIYATRGRSILELTLRIAPSKSPSTIPSKVMAIERVLCTLPDGSPATSLNPSCDGRYLSLGATGFRDSSRGPTLFKVQISNGKLSEVCRIPQPPGYGGHVQWSRTNPHLISFVRGDRPNGDVATAPQPGVADDDLLHREQRLWVVDILEKIPRNVYLAEEGELVTHESWWVNDQMLFCGGRSSTKAVQSHVKSLDIHTGQVRIVGSGAWWPEASPAEAAKLNWWHASGSSDGRWIAADNWHGDIMLFEGQTTRHHLLTSGHRTYGKGEHPHVGWDRKGEKVVFSSNMLGNWNVCVATIPKSWQQEVSQIRNGFVKPTK